MKATAPAPRAPSTASETVLGVIVKNKPSKPCSSPEGAAQPFSSCSPLPFRMAALRGESPALQPRSGGAQQPSSARAPPPRTAQVHRRRPRPQPPLADPTLPLIGSRSPSSAHRAPQFHARPRPVSASWAPPPQAPPRTVTSGQGSPRQAEVCAPGRPRSRAEVCLVGAGGSSGSGRGDAEAASGSERGRML